MYYTGAVMTGGINTHNHSSSHSVLSEEDKECPRCKTKDTVGIKYGDFKSCLNCLKGIIDEYKFYIQKFGSYEEIVNPKKIDCSCSDLFWNGCNCGAFEQERN